MVRPLARVTALALSLAFPLTAGSAQKSPDDPAAKKGDAPKPPPGWAEYSPRDGSYVVWVPEKTRARSERERTTTIRGQRLRVQILAVEVAGGPSYVTEAVTLSPALTRAFKPGELANLFRDAIASEAGGKVTDEADVKAGSVVGKEYRVESAKAVTRARVFVAGTRTLILRAVGRKEQVDAGAADTYLGSGRLTTGRPAAAASAGKAPTILGGAFDPEFKDAAPEGGLLVGFEIGFGKFLGRDMIRAARPIYRVGDKEVMGEQHGTQWSNMVTIKAKEGYAVGAMAVKHGLGFDGMSVTFMKVTGDKLDPADGYESEFVGSDEKKTPTKVTGNGLPAVGIVGKSNDKDMTGMGLLFKGQTFEPKKK